MYHSLADDSQDLFPNKPLGCKGRVNQKETPFLVPKSNLPFPMPGSSYYQDTSEGHTNMRASASSFPLVAQMHTEFLRLLLHILKIMASILKVGFEIGMKNWLSSWCWIPASIDFSQHGLWSGLMKELEAQQHPTSLLKNKNVGVIKTTSGNYFPEENFFKLPI